MNVCTTTMSTPTPSSPSPCKDPAVSDSAGEDPVDAAEDNATNKNSNNNKGKAGRIDYDKWHRVAKDLEQQTQVEEEQEEKESKAKLGLDGKYARSESEAQERVKAKQVQHVKKTIDKYKQREESVKHEFVGLLGPVVQEEEESDATAAAAASTKDMKQQPKTTIRITRNDLQAGKRVITICDTTGHSSNRQDTIVLTQDLSSLESHMAANALQQPKTYAEDAENDIVSPPPQQQQPRSVFGLIKLFIRNVHNCTILCKCKIISGTIEFVNCSNMTIILESTTTVATIQGDLSHNVTLEFHNAPSGKNTTDTDEKRKLYWGDDEHDDRIFHAGVRDMIIRRIVNDIVEAETVVDYVKDGATAVGNATAEEMQFITSMILNPESSELEFLTEQAVRSGQSTGKNARAMTPREVEKAQALREKVKERAINKAEEMIQIKDKHGNIIAKKEIDANSKEEEEVVEEVLTAEIKEIVDECLEHKAKGNEAFGAGEYGQAILLYSLALDKAAELPSSDDDDKTTSSSSLFPLDVVYSNRAACFLKLGQHEKALADADQARALNPNNVKAIFRSGLALHAMGNYMTALPILASAHKMEPTNAQIKQALQFCEVRLEQERRKANQG